MVKESSDKNDDGGPDTTLATKNAPRLTQDEQHEVEELKQLRVPVVY